MRSGGLGRTQSGASGLGATYSSLGNTQYTESEFEAESELGDTQSSLGGTQSSLGGTQSSLGGTQSSLGGTRSSLGGTQSSLGGTQSSLGGTKSSYAGTKSSFGGTKSSFAGTKSSYAGTRTHGRMKSSLGGTCRSDLGDDEDRPQSRSSDRSWSRPNSHQHPPLLEEDEEKDNRSRRPSSGGGNSATGSSYYTGRSHYTRSSEGTRESPSRSGVFSPHLTSLAASNADAASWGVQHERKDGKPAAAVSPETLKERQRRAEQRRKLTEDSKQEDERYHKAVVAATRDRRQRWRGITKNNPMKQDLCVGLEQGEEQRDRWYPERRSQSLSDKQFQRRVTAVFVARAGIQDEMELLRKEKKALIEQERQTRAAMDLERTKMRLARAAQLRPNPRELTELRKEQRDEERYQKQEFFRKITGWDGRKVKARSKSVSELWSEHLEAQRRAAAPPPKTPARREEESNELQQASPTSQDCSPLLEESPSLTELGGTHCSDWIAGGGGGGTGGVA